MKKNIISSAVAATVVTGALMLGGCYENSTAPVGGIDKSGSDETISITAPADGKVSASFSTKAISTGGITGKVTKVEPGKCVTEPCKVTVTKRSCKKDEPVLKFKINKCERDHAFAALDDAMAEGKVSCPTANPFSKFAGLIDVDMTGANSCSIDFAFAISCAIDASGQTYNVSQYDTSVKAWILVTPKDTACNTNAQDAYWTTGEITYGSRDGESGQPTVHVNGLDLNSLPASISVFICQSGEATGSTGSTGTTGAGD